MKNIRIRHPKGSTTLQIPPNATTSQVAKLIESKIPFLTSTLQIWKIGYPPKPYSTIRVNSEEMFEKEGVDKIDMLHVSLAKEEQDGTIHFSSSTSTKDYEHKEEEKVNETNHNLETTTTTTINMNQFIQKDNSTIPPNINPEGILIRRIMPDDGSCLFNSIGYTLSPTKSRTLSPSLRQLAAQEITSKPFFYTTAFLAQSPPDYIQSVLLNPTGWGGQIELLLFSNIFEIEIAAMNVITNTHDVYGSNQGYSKRIYVIYNGIHYDALAFTFDPSLPEEMDVTVFSSKDELALERALRVCEMLHREKEYTDTSNFTLRCGDCGVGLKGVEEAQGHAKESGHSNFEEYKNKM